MFPAAHTAKTLLCVSKDDLLAPYRTKERRRHEELCAVLRASYDCPLRFEDCLTAFYDEEAAVGSIMPLQVAEVMPGDPGLRVGQLLNWHGAVAFASAPPAAPIKRTNSTPRSRSCCVTRPRSRGGSDEPISKQGGRRIRGDPSCQGEIKVIGC